MPSHFFATRFRPGEADALKAFAAETMGVAVVLRFFIEVVLSPRRLLEPYAACFLDLCEILDIVSLHDSALQHLGKLRATIERHHERYIGLYGRDAAFPKFHYTMHLPEVMAEQGINLSAFVVERKHRHVKKLANHLFANFEYTLARTAIRNSVRGPCTHHAHPFFHVSGGGR